MYSEKTHHIGLTIAWSDSGIDFFEAELCTNESPNIALDRLILSSSADAEAYGNAHFGEGQGDIYIENVDCTGSEDRLADCPASDVGDHDCSHSEDAGIACQGM